MTGVQTCALPILKLQDMKTFKLIVLVIVMISLMSCANFAASVSGTFIGNIASDRVLKEMDKKEKK